MDRNDSNDRTTAGVVAATAIIASIALLALAGMTGSICAAIDKDAGGIEGEMTGAAVLAASVTDSINYQGRLADSSGSPLSGTYDITFRLYDVSTGGTALRTDTHDVDVADGLFNTGADFGTSYFDGRELWLGVTVGTDSEMTPRQELRPVPYALSLVPGAEIIGSAPVALHAESSHTTGKGIRGYATATSGTNCGVLGASKSPGGYGGYFYNRGGKGGGVGVYGDGGVYGGYFRTNQDGTGGLYPVHNAAVNATTTHDYSDGVRTSTTGYASYGVRVYTTGDGSDGVYARTYGNHSEGVYARTYGDDSKGVYARTYGDDSDGVYASTAGGNSHGVRADTTGNESEGVYASTTGGNSEGVRAYTTGTYSKGVYASTTGNYSDGVYASTTGYTSKGVRAYTYGDESEGVRVYTTGDRSEGVYTSTTGKYSEGVYAHTTGEESEGVNAYTTGEESEGVYAYTTGRSSEGVRAYTTGIYSKGVHAYTTGRSSDGVRASTNGYDSYGVNAFSSKSLAIYADTGRVDDDYAFYTYDNIYIGGKIDVVGTVDPIITECFNADPAVDYEVGDVVTLGEDSPCVKPCTEADDTKVVGVVGPTLDIEDGEISVVIMGYRGARPDEEHVKVLEMRLSDAEARMAEADLRMSGAEAESVAEKKGMENEVAMLRSEIEEAKSVTRQVVKVKADASFAPIKRGDLLTTSPTKGHAMKALPVEFGGVEIQRPGTLIGKAMEPLDSGTGLIEVFVTLQ